MGQLQKILGPYTLLRQKKMFSKVTQKFLVSIWEAFQMINYIYKWEHISYTIY